MVVRTWITKGAEIGDGAIGRDMCRGPDNTEEMLRAALGFVCLVIGTGVLGVSGGRAPAGQVRITAGAGAPAGQYPCSTIGVLARFQRLVERRMFPDLPDAAASHLRRASEIHEQL